MIYLDLDGTLVGFTAGVCRALGLTEAALYARWPHGNWNIHEGLALTEPAFWAKIDALGAAFWEGLDWLDDGPSILDTCERFGPVVLMTSPPRNPAAAAGKVAWIRRRLPRYSRRFAITPCKEAFAHPGAVLVDDSDANVKKFREACGKAVLVPRRWNALHSRADATVRDVEMALAAVRRGNPCGMRSHHSIGGDR